MKKSIFSLLFTLLFSSFLISCTIINNNTHNDDIITDGEIPNNNSAENNSSTDNNTTNSNSSIETPTTDNKNSIETKNCRIFFFDSEKLNLYYIDKDLKVENNALVTALTKELQTNTTSKTFLKLTSQVGIKSATLDKEKGLLKVVFNKSYTDEMLLGTSTEGGLLSSLINTYGYNYGVDKVAIYFGDELYTALKGDLPEGYFKTSYSEAKPYNSEDSNIPSVAEKNCRLYFYNGSEDCIYYSDKNITVTDNALTTALTNALKTPPSDSLSSIPNNVNVISANLDNSKDILTVNLSKDYYDILSKVGSGSEASLLQTLAMTYSYNYNVSKIIILIDNKPYSGSHILLSDGETVNFDLSNTKPL